VLEFFIQCAKKEMQEHETASKEHEAAPEIPA
jgi:hypothetical protein